MTDSSATRSSSGSWARRGPMALLIAVIVLSLAALGGWFWSALVFLMVFVGFSELRHMMSAINIQPSSLIVLSMGCLMVILATVGLAEFLPFTVTLAVILSFFRLVFRHPRAKISDIGGTLLSLFYVAYLPVHYILLRNLTSPPDRAMPIEPGLAYLVMLIVIIGMSDVGAYYLGKLFGREPLYPELSPKKTREGAVGGLATGIITGLAAAWFLHFPLIHAFILSILIVVVGQLGDLTESLFKRDAGMKDSGTLLKGHGGILDRTDSYVFSGAVAYYYIHWIVLREGLAENMIEFLHRLGWTI